MKPFAIGALLDTVKNVLRAAFDPCGPVVPLPNGRGVVTTNDSWQAFNARRGIL